MLIYWRTILVALISIGLLAGCAGNGGNLASSADAAKASLSLPQIDAVTVAARTMVSNQQAQVHGLTSRRGPAGAGLHVCGYVRSASHSDTPLYVELRENGAAFNAERGQVGSTPENLAKVKFMCRGHGEW